MRENTDQKNSEYGHFSRSTDQYVSTFFILVVFHKVRYPKIQIKSGDSRFKNKVSLAIDLLWWNSCLNQTYSWPIREAGYEQKFDISSYKVDQLFETLSGILDCQELKVWMEAEQDLWNNLSSSTVTHLKAFLTSMVD